MSHRRLAVIGAGKFGTTIARAAVAGGHDTVLASRAPAEDMAMMIDILVPGARAVSVDEAVAHSDLIVLAVPSYRFRDLPRDLFAGKVLVDPINYWPQTDGVDAELVAAPMGTSAVVQQHFGSARVVKSLNQLGYHQFEDERRPHGAPGRIAMAAAGDDRDAVRRVLALIDDLGFDPLDGGALIDGIKLQPGGPAFGVVATRERLVQLLKLGEPVA